MDFAQIRQRTGHYSILILFLFAWCTLNIIQAVFTEIGNDEAYYWVYSKNLAWGYFDHPPMIALLIRLGTIIWGDTLLGVRFFSIVLQFFFWIILYRLTNIERNLPNIRLFLVVAASVVMLQAYGFVTTPDVPLLFFSALFLYCYKRFVESEYSWQTATIMALSMALLMYSKYHGAIVISLVFISNIKILREKTFWYAVLLSILIYTPHIYWQVSNDFPSVRYHLVDRITPFKFSRITDFLLNQLPVFNPFTLGAAVYVLCRCRGGDYFTRTLKVLFIGYFLFFFIYLFKGRIEPHWTIVAAIPMVILVVRESLQDETLSRYVYKVILPSIGLILLARIFMMIDILPIRTEWHGGKDNALAVRSIAGDLPVVYQNQFQEPSRYRFYTQSEAHCIGTTDYRNTQYDIWRFDEAYRDKPVFINLRHDAPYGTLYTVGEKDFRLLKVEHYRPYKGILVRLDTEVSELFAGERYIMDATIENTYDVDYTMDHPSMPLRVFGVYNLFDEQGRRLRQSVPVEARLEAEVIPAKGKVACRIAIEVPTDISGGGTFLFAVAPPELAPATYVKASKIKVKEWKE